MYWGRVPPVELRELIGEGKKKKGLGVDVLGLYLVRYMRYLEHLISGIKSVVRYTTYLVPHQFGGFNR